MEFDSHPPSAAVEQQFAPDPDFDIDTNSTLPLEVSRKRTHSV